VGVGFQKGVLRSGCCLAESRSRVPTTATQIERLILEARMTAKKHCGKKSAAQPRTFEEVDAANLADHFHAARIARLESGERFDDPNGSNDRTHTQG
jgi:hypothetical protein